MKKGSLGNIIDILVQNARKTQLWLYVEFDKIFRRNPLKVKGRKGRGEKD